LQNIILNINCYYNNLQKEFLLRLSRFYLDKKKFVYNFLGKKISRVSMDLRLGICFFLSMVASVEVFDWKLRATIRKTWVRLDRRSRVPPFLCITWQRAFKIRKRFAFSMYFSCRIKNTCCLTEVNFITVVGQKLGLVVNVLDSRLEGCGFKSHPILDGNGVKAMPGLIPSPNPG